MTVSGAAVQPDHIRQTLPRRPLRRWAIALAAQSALGASIALLAGLLAFFELRTAYDARMADAGVRVNDSVLEVETEQLVLLRAIIFSKGFAEALSQRDAPGLQALVTPLQANAGIPVVDVLDATGRVVLAVRGQGAPPPEASRADWGIAKEVLAGLRDALGERRAAMVVRSDGPLIATAGPVRLDDQVVGAVLLATPVPDLLDRISVAPGMALTVYAPNGSPIATTFDATPPALSPEQAADLTAVVEGSSVSRVATVGTEAHRELLGRLIVRRQVSGVIGVASKDEAAGRAVAIAIPVWLAISAALVANALLARRFLRRHGQ